MFEQVSSDVTTYDKELADPNDKTTNQSTKNLIPVLKLIDSLEEISSAAAVAKTDAEIKAVQSSILSVTSNLPSKSKKKGLKPSAEDPLNVPGLKVRLC